MGKTAAVRPTFQEPTFFADRAAVPGAAGEAGLNLGRRVRRRPGEQEEPKGRSTGALLPPFTACWGLEGRARQLWTT